MLLIRNYGVSVLRSMLPIVPSIRQSAFSNATHNDSRSKEPALLRRVIGASL